MRCSATARLPAWVWLVTRLAGLVVLSGTTFYPQVDDDVQYHYFLWATLVLRHGLLPWKSFPVDYPPGVLPLMILPGGTKAYELEFIVLALVADALVARTLARSGAASSGLWGWVLLPVLLGPVMWVRLDVFVAAAIMGFVRAVERRRWLLAGLCVAAATLLKLWPAVLLVLIFPIVERRGWLRAATTAGVSVAVATGPVLAWGGGAGLWAMLRTQGGRGLEVETLWAAPAVLAHALGATVAITEGEGSPEILIPGWALWIGSALLPALLLILFAWLWRIRARGVPVPIVVAAGAALVLVGAKVLSPQYVVWAAAAVLLALDGVPEGGQRRRILLLTTGALAATTQWLYPFAYQGIESSSTASQLAVGFHAAALLTWVFAVLVTLGQIPSGESPALA